MAYRMQTSVPELMQIDDEPEHIHKMYGTQPGKTSFANNCLLARRMVERGVRFVQLFDQGWDMHGNVFGGLPKKCKQVDQPIAALIKDLKAAGSAQRHAGGLVGGVRPHADGPGQKRRRRK